MAKEYLPYYSKVFDYVEIDSTFYGMIDPAMTQRWAKITPPHFRFTAKMHQEITHARRLGERA
jgi:uncharacterized protein YecE (DUF72 family)